MNIIIFSLLALGLILLAISYRKDKGNNLEVQLENFSIQILKEMYQLKKKLKVIEDAMPTQNKSKY
ncbi:hypothetical protein SAMN04488137_2064 [Fictibacillus solisalsi]|uniref:Uncharacterized protein n=1 Tax=Fictibacillus solisalsi TaxID=459525 RepID=A0A1G9WCP6_9BACL|nr:hypothetical protein [Fictibacillus solisalsi]SDM81785.1 hypothetical protein SAMN04488137_2064 [Fictibacillus solisalsi]